MKQIKVRLNLLKKVYERAIEEKKALTSVKGVLVATGYLGYMIEYVEGVPSFKVEKNPVVTITSESK